MFKALCRFASQLVTTPTGRSIAAGGLTLAAARETYRRDIHDSVGDFTAAVASIGALSSVLFGLAGVSSPSGRRPIVGKVLNGAVAVGMTGLVGYRIGVTS